MSSRNSNYNLLVTVSLVVTIIGALLFAVAPSFALTAPSEVWVNSAWAGMPNNAVVDAAGHVFGVNATDTISNGSNMVADHGTVHVAAGDYFETSTIALDHPLILEGAMAGVSGNSGRGVGESNVTISSGANAFYIDSSDVTVDGFNVTDFSAYDGIYVNSNVASPYTGVVIQNNLISGCSDAGIRIDLGPGAVVKDNCVLGSEDGIYVEGQGALIDGNVVDNCVSDITYHDDGGIIQNNIIGDHSDSYAGGIAYFGDHGLMFNNTIYGDQVLGPVYIEGGYANFSYNTVEVLGTGDMTANNMIDGAGDNAIVDHNVLWSDMLNDDINWVGDNGQITNNKDSISPTIGDAVSDAGDIVFSQIVYTGNNAIISGNVIGNSQWHYNYSIAVTGGQATISNNQISADTIVNDAIYVDSEAGLSVGEISGNTINATHINDNGIETVGDHANVHDNILNASIIKADAINVDGNEATVSNNAIGDTDSEYNYGVYLTGDDGTLSHNTFNGYFYYTNMYVKGSGDQVINHNYFNTTEDISNYYSVLYYSGDNGVITNNDFNVTGVGNRVIDYDGGHNGVITDNTIKCYKGEDYYAVDNDIIHYYGDGGTIARNTMTADTVGDNAIQYEDWNTISEDSVGSSSIPTNGGYIAYNTLTASEVDSNFVYYYGDAGTIVHNIDYSAECDWPFVEYDSDYFGHATITDNTGGSINLYAPELLPDQDWYTSHCIIANNIVTSPDYGIAVWDGGDYNLIDNNTVNAPIGIMSKGTNDTISNNNINCGDGILDLPIVGDVSAGIGFDGDQNKVLDNTIKNSTIGIFNVGIYMDSSFDMEGMVSAKDTDSVNSTLKEVVMNVSAINAAFKQHADARAGKVRRYKGK